MIIGFKKIFLVFLFIVFFINPIIITAQENNLDLKEESINPGSLYYQVKRFWEKTGSFFKFDDQSKINYNKTLLKIRLSELNYVVNHKILSEIESSTNRISYQAGIITEEILKQNNSSSKEEALKEFEQTSRYLEMLRDKYNNSDSSFWRLIQYDIDSLKILSDRLR